MRAALYLRISKDKTGEAEGVERQAEDCRALIDAKGWTLVETFTDNDTSATSGRRRPGFEALMAAVDRRAVDVIVPWNADRLYRTPADRLRVVEACRQNGVSLHPVRGTGIDMTTPNGRMVAGMLGEMAWAEVENKSERQRRANRQAAEKGKPWLTGPRPFGYDRTSGTLVEHPTEGELVRQAFSLITSGASLKSVTRMLNEAGAHTSLGNEWRHNNVRVMLLNPLYAGLRAYAEMPPLGSKETARSRPPAEERQLVPGRWKGLVPEDVWRASVAILRDPSRATNVGNFSAVRHLGSNLFRCGRCADMAAAEKRSGEPVMGVNYTNPRRSGERGHRIYKCKRCHMSRRADPVDAFVSTVIAARLDRDDVADLVPTNRISSTEVAALTHEAEELRGRISVLPDMLADGDMTRDQFTRANRRALDRLTEVEAALTRAGGSHVLAGMGGPGTGERWLTSEDLGWRRAVLAALAEVVLHPVSTGRPKKGEGINPDSISFRWRGDS
ncbi:recombinase family protein [Micromonospora sp. WMMA1998]|uniref:recombinase family protein n=1 Tax=Micromonospora sp. WMMA1998 TaxID=3015167 RepID=UPI00248CE7C7|nr:recombinase family protein [Micromonospora sp. WMMA1998]WBC17476.1 recombinase family protein [Micromonospora sp. WMMA1998]